MLCSELMCVLSREELQKSTRPSPMSFFRFWKVRDELRLVSGSGARQPPGNEQHLRAFGCRRRDQAATKGQEMSNGVMKLRAGVACFEYN